MKDIFEMHDWHEDTILLDKSLEMDCPVYRYMSICSLLELMNGKFYVRRKKFFKDGFEQSEYLNQNIDNHIKWKFFSFLDKESRNKGESLKECNETKEYISKNADDLLVSCWTRKEDDYLMWKAYCNESYGAMITSSIHDIPSSFGKGFPRMICGKVNYSSRISSAPWTVIFNKKSYYESEDEVRFYIKNGGEENETGTCFLIDPKIMISKVIISPFVSNVERDALLKFLIKRYPFLEHKIAISNIIIND